MNPVDSPLVIVVGSGGVFGGKLHVIAVFTSQTNGSNRIVKNLLARFLQLELQVNVGGRDEGVDAWPLGVFERVGGGQDIGSIRAGQGGDRNPRVFTGYGGYGFGIAFGGNGETGFEDIHTEVH